MRRTLFFIIALLGIEGALAACKPKKPPKEDASRGAKKPLIDDGTGGSTTHNGLTPAIYWDSTNQRTLKACMKDALAPSMKKLSTKCDGIVTPKDLLLDYAISCAVSNGIVQFNSKGGKHDARAAYTGSNSALNTTGGWSAAKLNMSSPYPSPWEDLHTCIATRLNPSAAEVFIWLGGSHVNNDGGDHSDFKIDEALWSTIDEGSGPTIHVWPSDTIRAHCPPVDHDHPDEIPAVNTRVCGTPMPPKGCKVTVRDKSQCKQDAMTGFWSCPRYGPPPPPAPTCDCNGGCMTCSEVIHTKLKCTDWCTFYPSCTLPAECTRLVDSTCHPLRPSPDAGT